MVNSELYLGHINNKFPHFIGVGLGAVCHILHFIGLGWKGNIGLGLGQCEQTVNQGLLDLISKAPL